MRVRCGRGARRPFVQICIENASQVRSLVFSNHQPAARLESDSQSGWTR